MVAMPNATAIVIGPGAIGLATASQLRERGFAVGFLGRDGPLAVEARLDRADGEHALTLTAPTAAMLAHADIAFIATKAFDLEKACHAVTRLRPGIPVVPLANGAVESVIRKAAAQWPAYLWRIGFCTFGVSEVGPRHYAWRSTAGELCFGPLTQGDQKTAVEQSLLEPPSLPSIFVWHENILRQQRRKWIYNTVINTLTAARGLSRNGDLLHDLPMLAAVFDEAYALAIDLWGEPPLDRQTLFEGLEKIIERTSENENSMARDRRLLRRTESEYLAGLARDPRRFPLLMDLHRQITQSERGT